MDSNRVLVEAQLAHAVLETDFAGLGLPTRRELVDEYPLGDYTLWVVTDRAIPEASRLGAIPFKGEAVTSSALFWLERLADLTPSPVERAVDPQALILKPMAPVPVSVRVHRRFSRELVPLTKAGATPLLAGRLPQAPTQDDRLDDLVCAAFVATNDGREAFISRSQAIERELATPRRLDHMLELARALFERGETIARDADVELCHSAYDFALLEDEMLIPAPLFHATQRTRYCAAGGPARGLNEYDLVRSQQQPDTSQLSGPDLRLVSEIASSYLTLGQRLVPGFSPHPGPVKNRINHALSHIGLLA